MSSATDDAGLIAYQALAPAYDDFTAGYQAEVWTEGLEARALRWMSLGHRRLLDVGCGTGKSFLPMLRRGWEVVGCDISPAMLEIARGKAGGAGELHVADARHLPIFGDFDLVWAVNNMLNYVMSEEELEAALAGARSNLAPGGVLLFDLISLRSIREWFTGEMAREINGRNMRWIGRATEEIEPGTTYTARFEVSGEPAVDHDHIQRHFPEASVLSALERAGLECLEVWGDNEGEQEQPLDEDRHEKAIYIARSAT